MAFPIAGKTVDLILNIVGTQSGHKKAGRYEAIQVDHRADQKID